jgi:hypothetical protein
MRQHPDIEDLRNKSQKEVAEIYCDCLATSIWNRGNHGQATAASTLTAIE